MAKQLTKDKVRVYVLKPHSEPYIEEIDADSDYKRYKEILGIDSPITIVSRKIGKNWYDLIVDDEGLLKEKLEMVAVCEDFEEILCGGVIISKYDYNKECLVNIDNDEFDDINKNIINIPESHDVEYSTNIGTLLVKYDYDSWILKYKVYDDSDVETHN